MLVSKLPGSEFQIWQSLAARWCSGTTPGSGSTSLDVTVVVGAVRLRHVHLSHGQTHVVDAVPARWHALVDAVQTFGLLEAGDLVLGREPADGCGTHNKQTIINMFMAGVNTQHLRVCVCVMYDTIYFNIL